MLKIESEPFSCESSSGNPNIRIQAGEGGEIVLAVGGRDALRIDARGRVLLRGVRLYTMREVWLLVFAIFTAGAMIVHLHGCNATQVADARQKFHDAALEVRDLLTKAAADPALVEGAKAATIALVQKADPERAAQVATALAHIDQKNIAQAAQVVDQAARATEGPVQ